MLAALTLCAAPPGETDAVSIDRALIGRLRRGDDRAFRMIFDRHAPGVRRFLGDLLRDDAAADEATQETFVRAHRAFDRVRDDTKLRAWLFGIARNVFRERARTRSRRSKVHDIEEVAEHRDLGHAPSPQQLLLAQEADQVLARAMDALPADRRAALVLRLDHGLSYPDIAEAMEWNLPKVKNEIHRARRQLRAQLASYLEDQA